MSFSRNGTVGTSGSTHIYEEGVNYLIRIREYGRKTGDSQQELAIEDAAKYIAKWNATVVEGRGMARFEDGTELKLTSPDELELAKKSGVLDHIENSSERQKLIAQQLQTRDGQLVQLVNPIGGG